MEFREVNVKPALRLLPIRRYCSDCISKLQLMVDIYCERREMHNLSDEILKDIGIDRLQLNHVCSRIITDIPENRSVKSLVRGYLSTRIAKTEKNTIRETCVRKYLRIPFLVFGFTACTVTLAEPDVLRGELDPVAFSSDTAVTPCRACMPKITHGLSTHGLEPSTHAEEISWPCPKVSTIVTS